MWIKEACGGDNDYQIYSKVIKIMQHCQKLTFNLPGLEIEDTEAQDIIRGVYRSIANEPWTALYWEYTNHTLTNHALEVLYWISQLLQLAGKPLLEDKEREILFLAALFHDIGMGAMKYYSEEDQQEIEKAYKNESEDFKKSRHAVDDFHQLDLLYQENYKKEYFRKHHGDYTEKILCSCEDEDIQASFGLIRKHYPSDMALIGKLAKSHSSPKFNDLYWDDEELQYCPHLKLMSLLLRVADMLDLTDARTKNLWPIPGTPIEKLQHFYLRDHVRDLRFASSSKTEPLRIKCFFAFNEKEADQDYAKYIKEYVKHEFALKEKEFDLLRGYGISIPSEVETICINAIGGEIPRDVQMALSELYHQRKWEKDTANANQIPAKLGVMMGVFTKKRTL